MVLSYGARRGAVRHDKARLGPVWQGLFAAVSFRADQYESLRHGMAGRGSVGHGKVRCGKAGFGEVVVRQGSVSHGKARHGLFSADSREVVRCE